MADASVIVTVPIAKVEAGASDEAPVKVFGWALTSTDEAGNLIVDHDDDAVPASVLESAAYDFISSSGAVDVNHDGQQAGRVIESVVLTTEKRKAMGLPEGEQKWWVGVEVSDPSAKQAIRSGALKEFSILGDAMVTEVAA